MSDIDAYVFQVYLADSSEGLSRVVLASDYDALAAQLSKTQADFDTRMQNALLVNEARLDEIADLKEQLAAAKRELEALRELLRECQREGKLDPTLWYRIKAALDTPTDKPGDAGK
jgi:hypothetical protein